MDCKVLSKTLRSHQDREGNRRVKQRGKNTHTERLGMWGAGEREREREREGGGETDSREGGERGID